MLKKILILILAGSAVALLSTACSPKTNYYPTYGVEEFVLDSHKIQQGKFAILEMEGIPVEALPNNALQECEEAIDEGDIINIGIYHPSRQDLSEMVMNINSSIRYHVTDGTIILPNLGAVEIKGLTLEQARQKLQAMYNQQLQDLEVFLSYRDRTIHKVELIGEIKKTVIPVDGRMRLYELLAKAELKAKANLFQSYVVRDSKVLAVDITKLVKNGDMQQNIVMHSGDKIFIASASEAIVMVMGEVGHPQTVNVTDGFISLRQALVHAGGIPYTGDLNYIQVIRGNIVEPKVYRLRWDHILNLPNNSLLLMPGDVVFVSAKPITEWNRYNN